MRRPKSTTSTDFELESGWMATKDVAEQVSSYREQGYHGSNAEVPRVMLAIIQRRQIEASRFPIFSPSVNTHGSLSLH
jgi:hypothetical protein